MASLVDQPLTGELAAAAQAVGSRLLGAAPLGVAFSGGVDSSALLALAVRALGADQVVAILAVSPSLGSDERLAAHQVAAVVGARIVEIQTREADNPAYRANGPDRCFHCKDELFTRIEDEVAGAHGLVAAAHSAIAVNDRASALLFADYRHATRITPRILPTPVPHGRYRAIPSLTAVGERHSRQSSRFRTFASIEGEFLSPFLGLWCRNGRGVMHLQRVVLLLGGCGRSAIQTTQY